LTLARTSGYQIATRIIKMHEATHYTEGRGSSNREQVGREAWRLRYLADYIQRGP
jgi:hypothetical protein